MHEAYLRLVEWKRCGNWDSRGHFFAAAAEAMRRILVDKPARRDAKNRWRTAATDFDIDDTDIAAAQHPTNCWRSTMPSASWREETSGRIELVRLRYFAGLKSTKPPSFGYLRRNCIRHWTYARAWLHSNCSARTES